MGEGATLASVLGGPTASIVSADVALDSADPVVGSFTVDGLTYALNDGKATLVAVSPDLQQVTDSQSADDSRVAPMLASGQVAIPASVDYGGISYDVTAIGPYAFYLSGVTDVALPASVSSVDSRAFRSSDVAWADVVEGNPAFASSDGALYSADLTRLLLIPGGRQGAVRIDSHAEEVPSSAFSHCAGITAISVDAGGAAFSSWDGLLYSADGSVLLRVPAGASDITVRDGCTAIASGAMEGCAKLERINAPATVTSISPDVFTSVPTVSLPAQSALQDEASSGVASSLLDQAKESADSAPQLTAMVALSSTDDDLPKVDPSSIEVALPEDANATVWQALGFSMRSAVLAGDDVPTEATAQAAASYAAGGTITGIDRVPGNYAYGHLHIDLWEWGKGYQHKFINFCQGLSNCYGPSASDGNNYEALFAQNLPINTFYVSSNLYTMYLMGPQAQKALYWADGQDPTAADTEVTFSVSNGSASAAVAAWEDMSANLYVPNSQGHLVGLTTESRLKTVTREEFVSGNFSFRSKAVNMGIKSANPASACFHMAALPVYGGFVTYDLQGGVNDPANPAEAAYDDTITLQEPTRAGYRFLGWTGSNGTTPQKAVTLARTNADKHFVANWERVDFDIGFDVDSEPGDVDYPADAKDDQKVSLDDGRVEIEDPKRPGYVFEGWVIPTEDGTEAVDQDLVYQGDDGKWYVDASKLPDYAGDDGRVELTARWTSVISVDVPSSVTFYADLVTQGQESREGAASSAFGQSKVANQSQVDLRVVGLESSAVKTTDATLGADSILKKASAATPSTSTQKLLSLYPSANQWKPEDLQDPDAVGGIKATAAVDFDLDDVLLEKSFKADDFTIAAGDTLNMGYRLNLSETGQQLDYDKLSTLEEGQSASIANVSYTFAADALPSDWDEPLWIENPDRASNPAKYLLLKDIKEAANDLSANGTSSEYYSLYKGLLDAQVTNNGAPGAGPYFQLRVDGVYLPLQLIGICQDVRSDGSKAGLTFQMRDVYAYKDVRSADAGGGAFNTRMNATDTNSGGWQSSAMRATLQSTFWDYLPEAMHDAIVPVYKVHQLYVGGGNSNWVQVSASEAIWLPSAFEAYGIVGDGVNDGETITVGPYVPFQYQAYQPAAQTNYKTVKRWNGAISDGSYWWQRSATRSYGSYFCNAHRNGAPLNYGLASLQASVAPAFCL